MLTETALITALFSVLALILRPGATIGILIISMLVWPEYLRIPLGIVQMSAPRIVALLILSRFFFSGRYKKANLGLIDLFVTLGWVWTVLATLISGAPFPLVTAKIGVGLDTVLMFFAARFAILTVQDLRAMIMPLIFAGLYMGTMGVYESLTGKSPYHQLLHHVSWDVRLKSNRSRLGLSRAHASMLIHIYFGLSMFMVTSFLWSMRSLAQQKILHLCGLIAALLGALSSLSSGPWIAVIMFFFFNAFALNTKLIRYALFSLILIMIGLEIASNRHFYSLVDYLALNSGTAWYRTRLLEVAVINFRDYWLVGTGGKSINHWATLIDGRPLVDVVNHYIFIALGGGILTLFFYGVSHYLAVKRAIRAWKTTDSKPLRRLLFSLISMILALDVAAMSVGLFGPPLLLSNIALAVLVNVTLLKNETPSIKPNIVPDEKSQLNS